MYKPEDSGTKLSPISESPETLSGVYWSLGKADKDIRLILGKLLGTQFIEHIPPKCFLMQFNIIALHQKV